MPGKRSMHLGRYPASQECPCSVCATPVRQRSPMRTLMAVVYNPNTNILAMGELEYGGLDVTYTLNHLVKPSMN